MSGHDTSAHSSGEQRESVAVLHSGSVEQTRHLGVALGALLQPGDCVLLEGELGAGKTALTQGIGAGLDVRKVINSPTFTILKEYVGRLPLYHFDLYRIETPDEIYALGFEEYFAGDGVCVIEWAERGEPADRSDAPWPTNYLRIRLHADASSSAEDRLLEVTCAGLRGAALRSAWLRAALSATGAKEKS